MALSDFSNPLDAEFRAIIKAPAAHRYDPDQFDILQARITAARFENLRDLQPISILCNDTKSLKDEDIAYANRFREAGSAVEHANTPGAPRGFYGFAPVAGVTGAKPSIRLALEYVLK